MTDATSTTTAAALAQRVAELEAALAAERHAKAEIAAQHERLREAYQRLKLELELIRRRMAVAKAERIDTKQLELEFADKLAALDALAGQIGGPTAPALSDSSSSRSSGTNEPSKPRPNGRRDLREVALPEERVEITDPARQAAGDPVIDWEQSYQIAWRRGGFVRLVIARAKYRVEASSLPSESASDVAPSTIVTAPLPATILPRALASASLLAHIISEKFGDGLPLFRQQDRSARLGLTIDRGTMSRWLEEIGLTLGATVVHAMRIDAMANAFCITTDATGVLVQPIRDDTRERRPCRRGHYFVQIADRDHVFFEYTPRETSAAVGELFRGFSGYVQADAKSVFDLLFRPPSERPPPDDGEPDLAVRHEVGCWSHARRKFWEAAIAKDPIAREALARIGRIFDLDRRCRGASSPAEVAALRNAHLRPHVDAFFAWAQGQYELLKERRGLLRSAFGYAVRQQTALVRFFDDGRLRLDNNGSERELRRVAVGRKAWLFVGSDDHAQAAANLLTLIASARLHGLDPEAYLRDLLRVLPHWPRDRYLELCPRNWLATRARLDAAELARELGPLTIPPSPTPPEQPASR